MRRRGSRLLLALVAAALRLAHHTAALDQPRSLSPGAISASGSSGNSTTLTLGPQQLGSYLVAFQPPLLGAGLAGKHSCVREIDRARTTRAACSVACNMTLLRRRAKWRPPRRAECSWSRRAP